MAATKPKEALDDVMRRLDEATLRRLLDQAAMDHPEVERAVRLAGARDDTRLAALREAVDSDLRTRRYLDYYAADEWAREAQPTIDALAREALVNPSRDLLLLVQRGIDHSVKVILRGDDSNGSLGNVCGQLIDIHGELCATGVAEPKSLATWICKLMFEDQDFFLFDPVMYAEALGDSGLAVIRARVDEEAARRPDSWAVRTLKERLAVLDRDVDQIVALFGGDLANPYQFTRVALSMLEIGEPDLALQWALVGIESTSGWQVEKLYDIACSVLADRGDFTEVVGLRHEQHLKFASVTTFGHLKAASTVLGEWPTSRTDALYVLAARNRGAYVDVLLAEGDIEPAWLVVTTGAEWNVGPERLAQVAAAREKTHPADALSVYLGLVETTLKEADTRMYGRGVKLLKSAKRAAVAAGSTADLDAYVASLRERYRRRPSLIEKLDKAGFR